MWPKLLTKALRDVDCPAVKEEIEKRLKALRPKPQARCVVCSQVFEPRHFGRFVQNVCKSCRGKKA